jgi:uncharacterized DUF497 family protein
MVKLRIKFERCEVKNQLNRKKHGVSFEEASTAFSDANGFQLKDPKHSKTETRFYWVGLSIADRVLITYYTFRDDRIRIIRSAEWRKFRRLYYERGQTQ